VTLSLNEVEALAKKATRGAGYPWGIAEEAGKAVRWLCARDLDGCAALADVLAEMETSAFADHAPLIDGDWTSRRNRLCPMLAGVTLSDLAETLGEGELRLEDVCRPILLAPFAGLAAQCIKAPMVLKWNDTQVATDGANLWANGDVHARCASVTVQVESRIANITPQPTRSRAKPTPDALTVLNRLAHLTYAPATEESRLSGAGAGLSDND